MSIQFFRYIGRTKFGNSRRRIDENLPEVQARKRNRTDTSVAVVNVKKT